MRMITLLIFLIGTALPGISAAAEKIKEVQVLTSLVQDLILPSYKQAGKDAESLHKMTLTCATEKDLEGLRKAFQQAKRSWRRVAVFGFGPAMDVGLERELDFRPVRWRQVEKTLAAFSKPKEVAFADLGVTSKGYGVIEFLLFEKLNAKSEIEENHCAYLAALSSHIRASLAKVEKTWRDNFEKAFASGRLDRQKSLDLLVNEMMDTLNKMEMAIAKPFGKVYGNTPRVDMLPSYRSQSSKDDIIQWLESLQAVFFCPTDIEPCPRLASLLNAKKGNMLSDLNTTFREALTILKTLPSLESLVKESPKKIDLLYTKLQHLNRLTQTDVVGQLGVTLTFSDNDGD